MKKNILLFIASFILTISLHAQILSSKITSAISPTCSQDSNGSAAITAYGGFQPYTYLWEPSGQTTDTATGLFASTQYTVMVTDSGGVDTAISYLTLGTVSTLSVSTSSADASCFGLFNGRALVNITGGVLPYHVLWTPGRSTTILDTGLGAGTYTSTIIDSVGCAASASTTIAQPAQLALTAAAIDSIGVAIASGGTAPYTYSWSPGGFTSDTVRGLHSGTYTVTVTDGNLCSNIAVVSITGAELYFALGDTSVSCGNPSYFSFDVLISSDSAKRLNDCEFYLNIPQSEFAGDVLFNGIEIAAGPNFQYDSGANDYQIIWGQHDSVVDIALGSWGYRSPLGTIVDTTQQVLFHISLKITNSCATGAIAFDPSITYISYYVYEDSVYSHMDSTRISYTLSPYECGDSLVPPYLCNEYCCALDMYGHCIDSCYDTCNTVPIWCYDTIGVYSYDSSFSYYNYRNIPYLNTSYSAPIPTSVCPMSISSYTNPINAGTNAKSVPPNSSILTIKGAGFGSEKGLVNVTDANKDAVLTLDDVDILQWSENQIIIKMPDYSVLEDTLTPGSGPFTIASLCGGYVGGNLQINYNIENDYYPTAKEKARPNIVMVNSLESFNLRCDTSVWNNPKALACVKKAILTWNCYTGVDWKLGDDTALETTQRDGVSVIYFNNRNFSDTAIFMETQRF
ncbi:MAG TPA: SprB repeat-containing protein, partial [Bacteroidia bacterium]|nr:SprB repeat-containing protein [Bacteroidia bacterium]